MLLPQNSLLYTQNVHIECEQTCVTTDQSHIIIHLEPVEIGGHGVNYPPPTPPQILAELKAKSVQSNESVILVAPQIFKFPTGSLIH